MLVKAGAVGRLPKLSPWLYPAFSEHFLLRRLQKLALKRAGGRLAPHNLQQVILTCYLVPSFLISFTNDTCKQVQHPSSVPLQDHCCWSWDETWTLKPNRPLPVLGVTGKPGHRPDSRSSHLIVWLVASRLRKPWLYSIQPYSQTVLCLNLQGN